MCSFPAGYLLSMISLRRLSATSLFGLVTLASIAVLACLLLLAPPDGIERAQLMQFFGRLHPLAVHLPIALLIFALLLELAGRTRRFSHLFSASGFALGVATIGTIVAAGLGWCLARSGGYSGPLVTQHMWAGILVAAGAWLCWRLRVHADTTHTSMLYAITLVAAVGTVAFTGYRGGQLSQGENHLTEYMPAPLAGLLGVTNPVNIPDHSSNGGPETFYGASIHPIFARQCVTCHGRNKHKANLRLDSFEAVMRGGEHGPVIKAGDLKSSELFRRITLSPSDDDFMPKEKRPLASSDLKLIEQWIAAGASGTLRQDAVQNVGSSTPTVAEVTFEDFDPVTVAKQRAVIAPIVGQLQQQLPNVLVYQSRGSSAIVVNAAWMQAKFGDDQLAAFSPVADHIVSADFSNTAITDKSANGIAAMTHLRVLRLMHTRIGDASLPSFGSLNELESLSLFDTQVTPGALAALAHLPKLQHIYVSSAKISADTRLPSEIARKLVF